MTPGGDVIGDLTLAPVLSCLEFPSVCGRKHFSDEFLKSLPSECFPLASENTQI